MVAIASQPLDTLERKEDKKKREEYQYRAASTASDGYTTIDELKSLISYYIECNTEEDLRNALICLLSHYIHLRGHSSRGAELADLQHLMLENEGPIQCSALLFLMTNGKTNQHGNLQIGGCIRSKNVEICPLMMLGPYLFYRESFPNFTTSGDWFDLKLFKASDPCKEMSYNAHRVAIQRGLKECHIRSTKATHIFRGAGARMADIFGVDESQIRRNGQWNNSTMNGAYLTGLPRNLMRQLAGFPKEEGHFYLPRATLDPPEELKIKVFPEVERWQDLIQSGNAQDTTTADGFLKLLKSLRTIFLQDSVFMRKAYPNHYLWNNSLFDDPLYRKFSEDLCAAVESQEVEDPFNMQLRSTVPLIEQRLSTLGSQMALSNVRTENTENMMAEILQRIGDISSGRAPLSININVPTSNEFDVTATTINGTGANAVSVHPSAAQTPSSSRTSASSCPVPVTSGSSYLMSRGVKTLPYLWKEWHSGLAGGYSIINLDAANPKWFEKDKTFYSRRRRIIQTIKRYAADQGISETTAMHVAEERRQRLGKTIDYLGKHQAMIFEDTE